MTENKEVKSEKDSAVAIATENKYELSLEAMLKSGVHFGHKKSRWNPKMKPFIFGVRSGVHIIDLEKSLMMFEKALKEIEKVIEKNGLILIVGTKKQTKELVRAVADKLDMPYVNERWLGGTFTNFEVIKKRVKYLLEKKELLDKGRLSGLTKLERNKLAKKVEKIEEKMGGLVNMSKLPDLVLVLDVNKDDLAIREARNQGLKIVGILDTNSDPGKVDFGIPANDDALSSVKYILGVVMKRVLKAETSAHFLSGEVAEKSKK